MDGKIQAPEELTLIKKITNKTVMKTIRFVTAVGVVLLDSENEGFLFFKGISNLI